MRVEKAHCHRTPRRLPGPQPAQKDANVVLLYAAVDAVDAVVVAAVVVVVVFVFVARLTGKTGRSDAYCFRGHNVSTVDTLKGNVVVV